MEDITFKITGVCPLLMHNEQLSDPLNDIVKQIKTISSKKKKTDLDHLDMARLEWTGSLYWDSEIGPYLPGWNMLATLREGAKKTKKGRLVTQAITCLDEKIKLEYSGPSSLESMWGI